MRFSFSLFLLSCTSLCAMQLRKPRDCEPGPGWWFEIRHREPGGIGYDDGYTSGELFFSPMWNHDCQPFADLRIHLLNNGRWAGNAGAGFRYQFFDRALALGLNAFYDYRDSEELASVNQAGAGIEALTKYFEFRANGYVPFGTTKNTPVPAFSHFCRYDAIAQEKGSAVLPHIDAEFGFPMRGNVGPVDLFLGVGPYYLFDRQPGDISLGGAWGVKSRFELGLVDHVTLGAAASYDSIFNVNVQGYFGIAFPVAPRNLRQGSRRFKRTYRNCLSRAVAFARVTQRVERDDIMPIESKEQCFGILSRCQPENRILFVDSSLSGGTGTYEAPFGSLLDAIAVSNEKDIFYVFPGNPNPAPFEQTLTLLAGQRLIGSGISFDLNSIVIPPACPQQPYPVITVTPELDALLLANDCEVAGINFKGNNRAVNTQAAADFTICSCLFVDNTVAIAGPTVTGTALPAGTKIIVGSQFFGNDTAINLELEGSLLKVQKNTFAVPNGAEGVSITTLGGGNAISFLENKWTLGIGAQGENPVALSSLALQIAVADGGGNKINLIKNEIEMLPGVTGTGNNIELSVAGDAPGRNSWLIQFNTLQQALNYQANPGLKAFDCINLLQNTAGTGLQEKDIAYLFQNFGEQSQVHIESTDGTNSGVQSRNTKGIVLSENVTFVELGACNCMSEPDSGP